MAEPKPASGGVWLVAFLAVALCLNYVDRQMVYSIFPALRADLHFSDTQLGLIGSVFAWVYSLSMPFSGRLADRVRRDRLIAASMILWSVATFACGLSSSVLIFLFWRAVMGITESLYYPAAVGMLAAAHPGATRSRALGIHQSAQFGGIIIGGTYGGWMADHSSWRLGFAFAAMAGVVYSGFLIWRLPASKAVAVQRTGGLSAGLALFRSPGYRAMAIAFFAHCAMLWIFYAWLPAFLGERYGLSMTESGARATLFVQLACAAGVLVGATLADRLSARIPAARFYVAAAGLCLAAPFGYFTFATHSLIAATCCSAAYGFLAGLMIANIFSAAFDVVPSSDFGLASGVLNMIGGFAATLMIFIAGLLKGTIGFSGLLSFVAPACMLSALYLAWTAHKVLTVTRVSKLTSARI